MLNTRIIKFALIGTAIFHLIGCSSVARIENLPTNSGAVRFDSVERVARGHYEYVFTLQAVTDEQFFNATIEALTSNDFVIVRNDKQVRTVVAERGVRLNEWGSVVGIYSRRNDKSIDVKVVFDITQDFTGGFPQRYAENIAVRIRNVLHTETGIPVDKL